MTRREEQSLGKEPIVEDFRSAGLPEHSAKRMVRITVAGILSRVSSGQDIKWDDAVPNYPSLQAIMSEGGQGNYSSKEDRASFARTKGGGVDCPSHR